MTDQNAPLLVSGTVSGGLLRLTLPMILGISSSLLAGLAETWYLGQLGTIPLAAYSFTFPVSGALMSLSLGISIGVSSVLARTVGGGDSGGVRRIATDGISLVAIVMILVTIVGELTIDPLFRALGADNSTLPLIHDYMSIWYLSVVFLAVPSVGANALRATGDARISGTIMVTGSLLQIILGPFFIFGLFGLPALGITGAAVVNLIARLVLFMVTMYILAFKEHLLDYHDMRIQQVIDSWKRIMAVSIPATATNLIGPISTAIIVSLLAGYSQETVAGFGIASRIEGLFVIPLFALSASIGPFVGQNWGANYVQRANQAMLLSFKYSLAWGLFVAILLYAFGAYLASQFDDNPEVIAVATTYLLIVPLSYGTWGMLMMASAIFNSLGKPISSTIMSIIRMFVIYVPLAFLGEFLFGFPGIFAAAFTANLLMGVIGFSWNRKTYLPQIRQAEQ
ncbi:MAG: MATE family efflux transporter [Gammaproteobacteria bacterium]|nr:MATE family efflux transporter [Gammaproteobacteria bacterium]